MPDTSNNDKLRRIQWVESEWDRIAREVYRIKPSIINSDTLLDLQRSEFLEAQKVLDKDRQRNPAGIPSLSVVRSRLLEAVKKLRSQVQQEQAQREAQEAQARKAAELAAIPAPPPPNPYEVAFSPLVDLIANRVAEIMQDQLKQLIAQVAPRASQVEFKNLPNVSGIRRPKVVVAGGLPTQNNDIAKSFAHVDFVFISANDKANTFERAESADFIVAMTDFLNHSITDKIKAKYPEKYKPTTGSVSAVKRLIGILLNETQAQAQPQRASLH